MALFDVSALERFHSIFFLFSLLFQFFLLLLHLLLLLLLILLFLLHHLLLSSFSNFDCSLSQLHETIAERQTGRERERERALSPPPIEMDPESTQERCGRMSGRGQGESVARCAEVQRASLAPSPPPPHSHHHGGHHGCHYHLGGMSSSGLRS